MNACTRLVPTICIAIQLFTLPTTAQNSEKNRDDSFAMWIEMANRPTKLMDEHVERLERLGLRTRESIPFFATKLESDDVKARRAAAIALVILATDMPDATLPAAVRGARDVDKHVRGHCVAVLGKLGPAAASAVPVLIDILQTESANRNAVAKALGEIGPAAAPAVKLLIRGLRDHDLLYRASSAEALGGIRPNTNEAVGALSEALHDSEPAVQLQAARALWKITKSDDAIGRLVALLDEKQQLVRQQAVEALGDIGPDAKSAVPALERVIKGEDRFVGICAKWAVGQITGTQGLVESLVASLNDHDVAERFGAAWALGKMGDKAREAVNDLKRVSNDTDENAYLRVVAAEALKKVTARSAK